MNEPIKIKGIIFLFFLTSTLPARKKVNMLVPLLIVLASLLVAIAVLGGKPIAKSAGNEINPPPPTIAFNLFQQMSFVAKAKHQLQVF